MRDAAKSTMYGAILGLVVFAMAAGILALVGYPMIAFFKLWSAPSAALASLAWLCLCLGAFIGLMAELDP